MRGCSRVTRASPRPGSCCLRSSWRVLFSSRWAGRCCAAVLRSLRAQERQAQRAILCLTCAAARHCLQVPRGVSIGEVTVQTDRMAWNTTKVGEGALQL